MKRQQCKLWSGLWRHIKNKGNKNISLNNIVEIIVKEHWKGNLGSKQFQKIYSTRFGGNQVQALKNINFSVEKGEYVAIMGESGSGKTTLLDILAALDKPTAGEVLLSR